MPNPRCLWPVFSKFLALCSMFGSKHYSYNFSCNCGCSALIRYQGSHSRNPGNKQQYLSKGWLKMTYPASSKTSVAEWGIDSSSSGHHLEGRNHEVKVFVPHKWGERDYTSPLCYTTSVHDQSTTHSTHWASIYSLLPVTAGRVWISNPNSDLGVPILQWMSQRDTDGSLTQAA